MPSAKFDDKSQEAFIATSEDGWATRHLNPDHKDSRLERLHLKSPGLPRSSDGQIDYNLEHRYSDPKLFIKQQSNLPPEQKLTPAQIKRLRSIHKTLVLSTTLQYRRRAAEKALKKETNVTRTEFWIGVVLPFLNVKKHQDVKKHQTERIAWREELGKHMLKMKDGETAAIRIVIDNDHSAGACLKKLRENSGNYRLEVEFFGGDSNRSQKKIISFPKNVLTKTKGVHADGLHSFEDLLVSSKNRSNIGSIKGLFESKLDQFLNSVGGKVESTLTGSDQTRQKMGNCRTHNPEQALFRAIEQDPSLGPVVSKKFQEFLRDMAIAIIQKSRHLTNAEKMALQGLNAVNSDTKSRLERSMPQTSKKLLKRHTTLANPPAGVLHVVAGNDPKYAKKGQNQRNGDAKYPPKKHDGNMRAVDAWRRAINQDDLPILPVTQKNTTVTERALNGLKAGNENSAYHRKLQRRSPLPETPGATTKRR